MKTTGIATALACVLLSAPAAASLSTVWAVDDGTKVKSTDLNHTLKSKNGIYDGSSIKIFGARNETVAFQVMLQGGSSSTAGVSVSLSQVGQVKNSGVSNNPDSYFKGRNIELFKEVYHNVKTRSHGLVWEISKDAPAGWSGWVPDALVPLNIKPSFTVPASSTQAVWVDIYIPKTVQPGVHKGTLTVTVGGKACGLSNCSMPVELTVVNATIPDTVRAKTMVWFSGDDSDTVLGRYYSSPGNLSAAQVKPIVQRHFRLGRRHMITLFMGEDSAPNNDILSRVNGSIFSASAGYHGWGVGKGQDMYSIHTYGGKLNSSQASTWINWFKSNGPSVDYFLYVWDEPDSGDYSQINNTAKNAGAVPAFVTTGYTTSLHEVDIFCALAEYYSVKKANTAKAAGKRQWAYNGMRPMSGTFAIDDVAVSPRVNPWIQYKYDIPRWFFWEATYYNDFQGGMGNIDVFKTPLNFSNSTDEVNGDGLLIYPGTDKLFPSSSQGFEGPLPSIRLKNWRRGIQDVEYLLMAKQAGKMTEHNAALNMVVKKALYDETTYGKALGWSASGEVLLEARRKLAMLFKSTSPPPPDTGPVVNKDKGPVVNKDKGPVVNKDKGPPWEGGAPPRDFNTPSGDGTIFGGTSLQGGCGCNLSTGVLGGVSLATLLLLGVWIYRRRKTSGPGAE